MIELIVSIQNNVEDDKLKKEIEKQIELKKIDSKIALDLIYGFQHQVYSEIFDILKKLLPDEEFHNNDSDWLELINLINNNQFKSCSLFGNLRCFGSKIL